MNGLQRVIVLIGKTAASAAP
jgi:hypothetical protein